MEIHSALLILSVHSFLSIGAECSILLDNATSALNSVHPKTSSAPTRRAAKAFRSVDNVQLVPPDYNVFEPPPTVDGLATLVAFSIILMSVRDIKEKDEEFTVELNLRMFWKDTRLERLAKSVGNDSKFLVLNPNLLHRIWHPDVFIDHAISVSQPSLIAAPASLRIYSDSTIRYSARLTVKMACKMDFHFYPVDTQSCRILLQSYAYPTSILELHWRQDERGGAFMAKQLNLPNFDVKLEGTRNFTTKTSSGFYSNLELMISLKRRLSYHLIQTYLPSSIFLVVSWLSFLIPKESVPERIGSCMMTLLTLTVMFGSVGQNMPKVSYLTALDVWMVTCIVFVFGALIEFTVVLKLTSMEKDQRALGKKAAELYQNDIQLKDLSEARPSLVHDEDGDSSAAARYSAEKVARLVKAAEILESTSCYALPALFLLFNCIYWPWLNYFGDSYDD